jgi:hypothetical protein
LSLAGTVPAHNQAKAATDTAMREKWTNAGKGDAP